VKLVRYGEKDLEVPGIVDDQGGVRSLVDLIDDFGPTTFASLASTLSNISVSELPLCPPGLRLGAPFAKPSKIVCIGLNYRAHAETGAGLCRNDEIPFRPTQIKRLPHLRE
jgi:2-keto-4-pentenoate hydratase/2-oxohepta-3-ene-1,7-dioic acid hydratase in catechol pathway